MSETAAHQESAAAPGAPEEAITSKNFHIQVVATSLSKCGDQLTKPGLILTWMLASLGAPAAAIGALAPVREAGSLLPQIAIGEAVMRRPIRKGFWSLGAALQGICVLSMAAIAVSMEARPASWTIVGLLAGFSVARGVCSVTSKDLLGRTVPKGRRGRLTGISASVSGLASVVVALALAILDTSSVSQRLFVWLLGLAAIFWLTAALTMAGLDESPGKTTDSRSFLSSLGAIPRLLQSNAPFRNFCISRGLLAGTVLSMPFYVVLAHEATGGRLANLGALMVVGGASTALSSAIWGRLADRDSRLTLGAAGISAGAVGLATAAASLIDLAPAPATWTYSLLFFLIGIAHAGVRQGRKTYLVDMGKEQDRARLVAVSNTLIGVIVLCGGGVGFLGEMIGAGGIVLIFALLGMLGGALALRLPRTSK